MKITVHNKQRKHKVSLSRLSRMTTNLGDRVVDNIIADKPSWINKRALRNLEKNASLDLIIVSNQQIKALNKQWREKNQITDVLSFPLYDLRFCDDMQSYAPDELIPLGEIFIAYEQACDQAKAYNHTKSRELAFLFVHGFLHILGFDHDNKKSEQEMFGRQKTILDKCGYKR